VELREARFQCGELAALRSPVRVSAAYVFFEDEAAALSATLVLRAQPRLAGVRIVVAMWREGAGAASLIDPGRLGGVEVFAVLPTIFRPDLVLLRTGEVLARIRHDHYLRRETARGATVETNASLVPWDRLPAALQESNQAFADGIGRHLVASGCGLVPASLAVGDDDVGPLFDEDEVERLARLEHDRWMADLRRNGWRRTDGEKDPIGRLHPKLIPWEELDEEERERDRDAIRSLPQMLARAGFVVQRLGATGGRR
jgi:hypothetical protein